MADYGLRLRHLFPIIAEPETRSASCPIEGFQGAAGVVAHRFFLWNDAIFVAAPLQNSGGRCPLRKLIGVMRPNRMEAI